MTRATMGALLVLAVALPSPTRAADPRDLWQKSCARCHGADGKGRTKVGRKFHIPDFSAPKWQKEMDDREIRETIARGMPGKMPAFQDKLAPQQIDGLVRHVRSLARP